MNEMEKAVITALLSRFGGDNAALADGLARSAGVTEEDLAKWKDPEAKWANAIYTYKGEWKGQDPDRDDDAMTEGQDDPPAAGDVYIRGPIMTSGAAEFSRWLGSEATSAKDVRERMSGIKGDVRLRINSPGGSVSQMAEIFSLINERKGKGDKVNAIVDGVAASAAGTLFLACDERLMTTFATLMYHRSQAVLIVMGDQGAVRKQMGSTLQQLETFDKTLIAQIAKVTSKSPADAEAIIDGSTWKNAEDAISEGFATGMAFEKDPEDDGDDGNTNALGEGENAHIASANDALRALLALE